MNVILRDDDVNILVCTDDPEWCAEQSYFDDDRFLLNTDVPNMRDSKSIYSAFHNLYSLKISTKYGKKSINTAKKWEIRMILVLGLKP